MKCKLSCDKTLRNIALGFSILFSDKANISVTVFDDPLSNVKSRVRLTRNIYKRGRNDIRDGSVIVSLGRPNFREREFLKLCRKSKCKPYRFWISRRKREMV